MNLVLNARDAVEGGGRIEIQTRYETVGAAAPGSLPPGGYGVISVRDDGVGIERDDIERIFEPFYTTKEDGKGTGLGLATVHGIVTQSGGYVDVDSTPGQGSEFTIWLPEATEEQRDLEFSELEGAQARSEQRATILLVDDNALVRRSLVRGLERGGYRTLTAANGREALDMWRRHDSQIAAVVSDVIMPAMDGLELLATLKEQAPEMPVFLLTGYAEERDLGAESRRADEILRKPISPAKLCDALSAHLAKEAGEGWAPVA
jgi:two-component system cell cycle sensor histidine kinase/response regulator CckA